MTIVEPPRELRIAVPGYRQWTYVSAMIAALVAIGSIFMTGARLTAKMDDLSIFAVQMKDTPQQIALLAQHNIDMERRVSDLEMNSKVSADRYQQMLTSLSTLQAQMTDATSETANLRGDIGNVLNAITGRPYHTTAGKQVR